MKATVLVDNIAQKGLKGEWGLSIHIEHEGRAILLDTGASSLFEKNAEKLGIDLSQVDAGVLSHAHYDHANGMDTFFKINSKADFHLNTKCAENCFGKRLIFTKYIGIKKGLLEKHHKRLRYDRADREILPGCHLIAHKTAGLEIYGEQTGLYKRVKGEMLPDNFNHEQSLVIDTDKGLVIFNSCSHAGPENIIREIAGTFPDKKIYGYIGGLHLYRSSAKEVERVARELKESPLELIVTGHCTGKKPYMALKKELGDRIDLLSVGKVIEI